MKKQIILEVDERELEDDYPINPLYLYVGDGSVFRFRGEKTMTAKEVKEIYKFGSLTNCDIVGRNLSRLAV